MSGASGARAGVLLSPATASLKRIAWAYGCSPKGSNEEHQLEQLLREKIAREPGVGR